MIEDTFEEAYAKVEGATRIILDQIRKYPHLMDQILKEVEIAMIKIAMKRTDGNCSQAAKLLGINRTTLVEKRRRYKMELKMLDE